MTAIKFIAEYYLGYNIEIINISKNTKVQDLLGKEIIMRKENGSIDIKMKETKLMKYLKKNEEEEIENLIKNKKKTLFIFNNINNANQSVMELLASIFDKKQTDILSYDGTIFKKNNIDIIGIFNPQNGESKEKLLSSLLYSSLYHIVLEPDEDSVKSIILKKLEKEKFKEDSNILIDAYKKIKNLLENKYQKQNSINLNDISKYISFRRISFGQIDNIIIILSIWYIDFLKKK
jgi:MoxR-like ATPase